MTAKVELRIEYLEQYQEMARHQVAHYGKQLFESRPWEFCLECMRESLPRTAEEEIWKRMQRTWSWAIPTEGALAAIKEESPGGVVEIGAGGGYWAMLLRERGVDVIAYDADPPPTNDYWFIGKEPFSEVIKCDHHAVIGHGDRTLFLCWPSYDLKWTHEVIELYPGNTVIVIGEGSGGCTGTERMHELLGEGYEEQLGAEPLFTVDSTLPLPQWHGLHDYMTIYRRI